MHTLTYIPLLIICVLGWFMISCDEPTPPQESNLSTIEDLYLKPFTLDTGVPDLSFTYSEMPNQNTQEQDQGQFIEEDQWSTLDAHLDDVDQFVDEGSPIMTQWREKCNQWNHRKSFWLLN